MPSLKNLDIDRVIGQNIRIARGRTQPATSMKTLAAGLGCSYQQVAKYESGQDAVSVSTLVRMSAVLDQPFEWFLTGVVGGAPSIDAPTERQAA